ncbi:MAG TPA: hypothetical protein VK447_16395 [Myxococcaceae bacterium]|nr:hypothetical protein [Myxococcaceae bacterium]
MSEMSFGGPTVGICARHSGQAAAQICERCGNFMCALCSDGGRERLCPDCVVRTGVRAFPLNRANWNFDKLWTYCFARFQREWLMLSLAAFVFVAIFVGSYLLGQLLLVLGLVANSAPLVFGAVVVSVALPWSLLGIMDIGTMHMSFHVLNGRKADVGLMFAQAHKAGRCLVAMLIIVVSATVLMAVIGFVVALVSKLSGLAGSPLPASLCVGVPVLVVLLYFALPLYLLPAEFAYSEETSAVQLLKNCYTLADGERWSILGLIIVSILLFLVGLLACCVGVLPALGMLELLRAGMYLSLRTGADLPEPSRA